MIIQLGQPTNITAVPATVVVLDSVDKLRTIDDGFSVSVILNLYSDITREMILLLWNETTTPSYSEIGNWTDEQVNARIIEQLLSSL